MARTLQLNYANPDLQNAMALELERIQVCATASAAIWRCCYYQTFSRELGAYGRHPFGQTLSLVHGPGIRSFFSRPRFYWDLECTLQQEGFDYTYGKRLYDRLRDGHARPVRDHFRADIDFQRRFRPLSRESRRAASGRDLPARKA